MIQEEFVQYETAKLLKEAGFPQDDDCKYYDNEGWLYSDPFECVGKNYAAPTQAQAMRWLREVYDMSIRVNFSLADKEWFFDILNIRNGGYYDGFDHCLNYEDAVEAGIQVVCEYLIEQINNE